MAVELQAPTKFMAPDGWKVPWYLDCRNSPEWMEFKKMLTMVGVDNFQEDLFWWSHALLEKTEPIFLKVQNTKHFHYICWPNTTETPMPEQTTSDDSIFNAYGGTNDWSDEERERNSFKLKDFCYYGYMVAAAYRSRRVFEHVPGVLEGQHHARRLVENLLMSKSNMVDFLDSSGWPMGHMELLKYLYPPAGPFAHFEPPMVAASWTYGDLKADLVDDTERAPANEVLSAVFGQSNCRSQQPEKRWVVAALGYHTTLVMELVTFWKEFLGGEFRLEVAAHVLEPGAGTAEEIKKKSLCREFLNGELCGWDARLLEFNKKHVDRGKLPITGLPSPLIRDPEAFMSDFAATFSKSPRLSGEGLIDSRLDHADVYLCTEPAILCGAVGRAFPDRPTIAYFANPLTSYVQLQGQQEWLLEFHMLARRQSAPFLPVASTRFLAEQFRSQTGVEVLAIRPLATYLGPIRGRPSPGEVIVLRAPSIFWNAACIINSFTQLNANILADVHAVGEGSGIPVPGLSFVAGEDLPDGASEVLASFSATVIFPYDVSQMRLYELYALGVPLFVPAKRMLPSYLYRGMTTIEDFDHKLSCTYFGNCDEKVDDELHYRRYSSFDRSNWYAVATWTQLTHWVQLPHLFYFDSVSHLLLKLVTEDLRPAIAGMRRRQEQDIVRATLFWSEALVRMGLC